MTSWNEHQAWENDWWGDCTETFGEEAKQLTYAHRMGLVNTPDWRWPRYNLDGLNVIDFGGGPVSILLKCLNFTGTVVDPGDYPQWVIERYWAKGIEYLRQPAENVTIGTYDECWMYNVLQHTIDPQQIVENARTIARTIRIFEWVDATPTLGHPHELHARDLDAWLHGHGTVEDMHENGCVGPAYYGTFAGTVT